jgi:hypothetical protein
LSFHFPLLISRVSCFHHSDWIIFRNSVFITLFILCRSVSFFIFKIPSFCSCFVSWCSYRALTMKTHFRFRMSDDSRLDFKVGLVGNPQCGKTALMVRYVQGTFDEEYILTLGFASFF